MEPGRTLFMTMRVCNEAMLCSNKSLGSVTITNNKTKLQMSEHGESIRVDYDGFSSRRKKRDISKLSVTTPDAEIVEELTTDYRADVALNFQPYIVNPTETEDMVERLLFKRMRSILYSFSITPVGHLPMPGPLNITIEGKQEEDEVSRISLIYWNPTNTPTKSPTVVQNSTA
ncbi:unnamed protein product [Mytilus edulis]|uniref:Uncharacterized protein n=1 Tax=Mytilus edulis TaxID=6550 RepID=A0A8S3S8D0_MYTED|nr:unnamed protein product [Mytilus edulis]